MNSAEKSAADEKPNLWIVTELYYPEETSTGYYLTRIAEGLTDEFNVRVVCGQPNYSARGVRAARRETRRNVEIFRVFSTTLDKNKIFNRLINMVSLAFAVFFSLLGKLKTADRILVVTTPPTLPLVSAAAALLRGAHYVLLIHDNYPEILIASGKASENSPGVRFNEFLNRWVYKYAAKIIVVGRDMKKLVERKTGGLDVPVTVIPNWAELETVKPQSREDNRLLRSLNLENRLVFLYAGNMGYPNDLESFVWCAEKLLETNLRIHFIFLGAGVKKRWLENECRRKNLINITILEPKPRSEQTDFLNACDVALVSLVGKMRGVSMPSRTYNILAAGKPILALTDEDAELALVVAEENVGWIVKPGEKNELLKVINEIAENSPDFEAMRKRARAAAVNKYSAEILIDKYRKELRYASDNEKAVD